MEVSLTSEQPLKSTQDTLVVFDFEGAANIGSFFEKDAKLAAQLKGLSGDFQGKEGQLSAVYTFSSPRRLMLVGLGKKDSFHLNKLRLLVASVVNYSRQAGVSELVFNMGKNLGLSGADAVAAVTEASILADHKYDKYKSEKTESKLNIVKIIAEGKEQALQSALDYSRLVAENCCSARDLVNTPASIAFPQYIADLAEELSKKQKVKCTVYGKKELQKMNANGLLAVGSASDNEPRMVVLEYSPAGAKKSVALVGKGITFDSGGLDIKPAAAMETMKHDMSGASAVLFTVLSAAQLKLPIKVIGILAITENMVGPNSYKPGDIIRTMSGKTIEILNTDAEGRVVLSDALFYAKSFKPDCIVDVATLTGACIVALGKEASGLVSNDSELVRKFKDSGNRTFERVWELPFFDEYQEYIKSDFADLKNVTSNQPGSGAGAITAAKFLSNFIEGSKWAHLDIAGTAWSDCDCGYTPKGATGVGVRLLVDFLARESR